MNLLIFNLIDALYSYGNGADCDKYQALELLNAIRNKLVHTEERPSKIVWNTEREVFEVDC